MQDTSHYQQDSLQRTDHWLAMLEERVQALMITHSPEKLKPGECEQAISRYLALMLRFLQLRQQYAKAEQTASEQALLDTLLHGLDE